VGVTADPHSWCTFSIATRRNKGREHVSIVKIGTRFYLKTKNRNELLATYLINPTMGCSATVPEEIVDSNEPVVCILVISAVWLQRYA
jgi:hypothetical protein